MMTSEDRQRTGGGPAGARAAAGIRADRPSSMEARQLTQLASELQRELGRRWPTYYPAHASFTEPAVTFSLRHCGFSVVFKADLAFEAAGERKRIVIKIRREHKHGSVLRQDLSERTLALSRAEYDEHVKAYQFFQSRNDGLSVVRPLDLIESHNALVVEHAVGNDLSALARVGGDIASGAIRRCGQWWRLFHYELHQARQEMFDAAVIDAAVDRRLTRLRAIGAPGATLAALREEITTSARRLPASQLPFSVLHGDCKLRHVWAAPEQIQVLDFGNAKTGCSWIDPAALVVELSVYSLWTRHMDSSPKVADIRTLLDAYFEGPPPPAFFLYVVDGLLKKWHRRLRHWGPGAGIRQIRRSLQVTGLDKGIDRLYIDRWFTGQIRAWLALAEGHPPAWLDPVVR